MSQAQKKQEPKQTSKILEIHGHAFNPQDGELTLGDLEEFEHKGIDFTKIKPGDGLSISKTNLVAQICLLRANPEAPVDAQFMASIPAKKIKELGEFVTAFFTRNSPDGGKK